jgi:hypothetical protein
MTSEIGSDHFGWSANTQQLLKRLCHRELTCPPTFGRNAPTDLAVDRVLGQLDPKRSLALVHFAPADC